MAQIGRLLISERLTHFEPRDIAGQELRMASISDIPTVRAIRIYRSLSALNAEFAGRIPEGQIVPVSEEWGHRTRSAGEGFHHTYKFFGMTSDGLRVCTRNIISPPRGEECTYYESGQAPNIVSCLRAAGSSSVESIQNRLDQVTAAGEKKPKVRAA